MKEAEQLRLLLEQIELNESKIRFNRVAPGEYTFPGGFISVDEYERGLWWVHFDAHNSREDVYTLRAAKELVVKVLSGKE